MSITVSTPVPVCLSYYFCVASAITIDQITEIRDDDSQHTQSRRLATNPFLVSSSACVMKVPSSVSFIIFFFEFRVFHRARNRDDWRQIHVWSNSSEPSSHGRCRRSAVGKSDVTAPSIPSSTAYSESVVLSLHHLPNLHAPSLIHIDIRSSTAVVSNGR